MYLERRLDAAGRAAVEAHLLACADCRTVLVNAAADIDEAGGHAGAFKSWPVVVPFQRRKPVLGIAGAMAAAAVLVLAVLIVPLLRKNQSLEVAPNPAIQVEGGIPGMVERGAAAAPPAAEEPGGAVVPPAAVVEPDAITFLGRLPNADANAVNETLRTMKIDLPPSVAALRGRRDPLRGGADSTIPRLLDPIGTRVSPTRPTFEWEPVSGSEYEVTVFDADGNQVVTSGWTKESQWTPPQDLGRGRVYSWQLAAKSATSTIRTPGLADPPAQFAILTDQEAGQVAQLREQSGNSRVVLGILMARSGLLAEAETLFEEATAQNPDSGTPRQLLNALRAARTAGAP